MISAAMRIRRLPACPAAIPGRITRVGRRIALLLSLTAALGAPAAASAKPVVGIGDQKPTMFADPRLGWLRITTARIVVSWRVGQAGWERPWVDNWLKAARRAGVRPLVGFGHVWAGRERTKLPSVAQYRRAVAAFHARYPWVRDYIAWNEANHCSQPTCHHPERAAAYYDALVSVCPRCRVVAADVIDQGNMVAWLRAYEKAVKHRTPLWGLHNYLDVNRLRASGTLRFLRTVKGRVWITETGGIVRRTHYAKQIAFTESEAHAARATDYALKLAARHPRIGRIYLYKWNTDSPANAWDSGLVDWAGGRRAGFDVLARFRGRDPAKAPAIAPFPVSAPPPSGPPSGDPTTPDPPAPPPPEPTPEPAPAPPPATTPAPAPAPPPVPCLLPILCPA